MAKIESQLDWFSSFFLVERPVDKNKKYQENIR
nr:MAG TPA: hypothetical protein [Caudoviricetes sp.]